MRALRSLGLLAVLLSLLAMPASSAAQDGSHGTSESLPLARQPLGTLPLEGTPWRLRSYRWQGAERVPGPEVAAAMTLSAGTLTASGGCTAFRGTYGMVGSAARFRLEGLKANECAKQTTMVQRAMVDGLRKAARFEISAGSGGDQLALFNAAGSAVLRFGLDDVGRLTGGDWLLEAYTVDGVRERTDDGSLRFGPERRLGPTRRERGTLVGATGCNGFTGDFFRQANVISFGPLTDAGAPCTPSLQRQQEAMLAVLGAAAIELELPADRLVLTSRDTGDSLEFRAAAALEGTTWVLDSGPDERAGPGIVTLRLEDGIASGQGPCGPYGGEYRTDGLFITFSGVSAPGDEPCDEAKRARALLAALRAGVRLDRDPGQRPSLPQLTLRDALGRPTARFVAPYGTGP